MSARRPSPFAGVLPLPEAARSDTTRRDARAQILKAVNKARQSENAKRRTTFFIPMLYGRHIQQAVCIARRNRLVDTDVLLVAGFNARRRAS